MSFGAAVLSRAGPQEEPACWTRPAISRVEDETMPSGSAPLGPNRPSTQMAVSAYCRVLFVGVLVIRALVFGVYVGARHFEKSIYPKP